MAPSKRVSKNIARTHDVPKSFMPQILVTEDEVRKCVNDSNIYKASSVPNISSRNLNDSIMWIIWIRSNKCDVNNLGPVRFSPASPPDGAVDF